MRTHLDLLRPSLAHDVQQRQRVQQRYANRWTQERCASVGDPVWVTAVDRLRGAEEKRWLPGISPRSPLSGCLYRDVTWATESLAPFKWWNMAEMYGGLAP